MEAFIAISKDLIKIALVMVVFIIAVYIFCMPTENESRDNPIIRAHYKSIGY